MDSEFELDESDLKHYPHFDAPIPLRKVNKLLKNRRLVAENAFYPFIRYTKSWQPFNKKGKKKGKKRTFNKIFFSKRCIYLYSLQARIISVLRKPSKKYWYRKLSYSLQKNSYHKEL